MKTVLQINSVCNLGSTGRIAEDIGSLAIENGWQSYIAYGRKLRPGLSKYIKIGTTLDIIVHGIYTRLFDLHGFASVGATHSLVRKIREIDPDVIHLHNLHGYYLNFKILFDYLKTVKTPVVWTLHDCWPITGHCVYFDFVGCDKWKTACFDCPQKTTYPGSILFDHSKTNYKLKKEIFSSVEQLTIVPVSQWLSGILKESFLNNHEIKVVHNGIDLDTFTPQLNNQDIRKKYQVGDRLIILGVAGVWSKRKGLNDFKVLAGMLPDDCIIILVGLKAKDIRGLSPNIIGITHTEDLLELVKLYSAADLYMNPTWEDNFPTTNLEALACGTPVVTYRTGGSVESVSPETGFIVQKGDIAGLLNAIDTVRVKGKNSYLIPCRERAQSYFNKKECFKKYIELFEIMTKNTEDFQR
jgi:glycosyltransferase involved in cell wall biosynthesis